MDDIKLALLGSKEAAKRLTDADSVNRITEKQRTISV